jgi:hypothetical protein
MGTGAGDQTSWRVVDEDLHEVLAHGSDDPPSRGRRLVLTLGVAVAAATWFVVSHGPLAPGPPAAVELPLAESTAAAEPSLEELAGVWLVIEGPDSFAPGEMWMSFHPDGSFALDSDGALLSERPWVSGHFMLDGRDLTLIVEGGEGCRPGDRFRWWVGILPSGRLETRHHGDNHGRCRVDPGVWQSRPAQDSDLWRVSWRP